MRTSINEILAKEPGNSVGLHLRLVAAMGQDPNATFDLADLMAIGSSKVVADVLKVLGHARKTRLIYEFAVFCAVSIKVPEQEDKALQEDMDLMFKSVPSKSVLRHAANDIQGVVPKYDEKDESPVWRKRRAIKEALFALASDNPVHAAHYAAYAYHWAYQVNWRGLDEKFIELLLEDTA